MIFLLSCVFTGSLTAPNNDGDKKAIKTRYDCFRFEVCHHRVSFTPYWATQRSNLILAGGISTPNKSTRWSKKIPKTDTFIWEEDNGL